MGRRCLSTSSETPIGLNLGKRDRNKKTAVTRNNSQRLPFGSLGKQAPGLSKSDALLGRENVRFSCLFRALTPVSSWSTHCRALHAGGQRLESSTAGHYRHESSAEIAISGGFFFGTDPIRTPVFQVAKMQSRPARPKGEGLEKEKSRRYHRRLFGETYGLTVIRSTPAGPESVQDVFHNFFDQR